MKLRDDAELANTRAKLREVEQWYEELSAKQGEDERVKQLTLRSYRRVINQLKEEIARYQACSPVQH
jgi:hypothetical protein